MSDKKVEHVMYTVNFHKGSEFISELLVLDEQGDEEDEEPSSSQLPALRRAQLGVSLAMP